MLTLRSGTSAAFLPEAAVAARDRVPKDLTDALVDLMSMLFVFVLIMLFLKPQICNLPK